MSGFLGIWHFNVRLGRSESQRLAISLESLGCPNLTLKWILSQPNVPLASGPRRMKFRTFGPALKAVQKELAFRAGRQDLGLLILISSQESFTLQKLELQSHLVVFFFAWLRLRLSLLSFRMKNQNSKKEDLEEEDQRQDERNVIL